ncbi:hypothetical protein BaRGS_00020836 [Batillaria attramentaria]|uniref:Dynein regulatory complex protein 10 n=1 Tax=Batillaria attramentaria TaxID=370345 RepID=A0ABD0KL56_9CAEN
MAMAFTMTETVQIEPTMNMTLQTRPHPPKGAPPQKASIKLQNLRIDPTRALEPARKKLTTLEAQRVMAVFEETIRRVEIVTLLPYIMNNIDRYRVSLGGELVELLNHHGVIVSSYNEIRKELDRYLGKRSTEELLASKTPSQSGDQEEAAEAEESKDEVDEEPSEAQTDAPVDEAKKEEAGDDEGEPALEREGSQQSSGSRDEGAMIDALIEAAMRNLSLVAQQMSHSVRNVLRGFAINPAVVTLITADMAQRGPCCKELLTYLNELREILMGKLLTTPEEEQERMLYLSEISKRERHNAVIIEKLEADLQEKNDDKDEEIRRKNDIIKRLQSELHAIEKFSEEHIRRVRADAEKQEAADEKNSDGKRQKLQTEVGQLRSQLQNAIQEHREVEQDLRRKKFKVETEVENWIQRYDQELGEMQDEYEEIDEIYTEEKKQLHELEERFRTLEAEYISIMDERRLAREKREKAERELAMLVKSATTIQAFWRSYKVRKALKARKKKKGKKGGKKGGKKK